MRYRLADVLAILGVTLLFAAVAGVTQATDPDWKAVEQALGNSGQLQAGDVFRVGMPRTDLSGGLEVTALLSWHSPPPGCGGRPGAHAGSARILARSRRVGLQDLDLRFPGRVREQDEQVDPIADEPCLLKRYHGRSERDGVGRDVGDGRPDRLLQGRLVRGLAGWD